MSSYRFRRLFTKFAPNQLTDDQRDSMVAGILTVSGTSSLVQGNQAMKVSAGSLSTKAKTFQDARLTAANSKAQAEADAAAVETARQDVDAELYSYVNMGAAAAKTAADLTGAGIEERPPAPSPPPFAPPDLIDVTFFKNLKGKCKVTAHGFGKRRLNWAVQMCQDPSGNGPWTEVYGVGNSRTISGPSGSRVWVRYAMLRDGQQSGWSTPVLVTIP